MEKRNESLCATKSQNLVISERYSYLFYTFFSVFMSCAHNKIYFFRQLPNEHNFRESPNIDQECCVECERERAKRINLIQHWPSFHVCAACCLCNRNVWRLFIIFFHRRRSARATLSQSCDMFMFSLARAHMTTDNGPSVLQLQS